MYWDGMGGEDESLALRTSEEPVGGSQQEPGSPKWSTVVKRGKRQFEAKTGIRSALHGERKPGKVLAIVGTGAASHIKTVTTKLVSVFASKFSPDLDVQTLTDYLKDQLHRDVVCQKIATRNTRFASFKVTAECRDVAEMYNPEIWPVGSYVRRFYEPRSKAGVSGSNAASSAGLMSLAPSACDTEAS